MQTQIAAVSRDPIGPVDGGEDRITGTLGA